MAKSSGVCGIGVLPKDSSKKFHCSVVEAAAAVTAAIVIVMPLRGTRVCMYDRCIHTVVVLLHCRCVHGLHSPSISGSALAPQQATGCTDMAGQS